MNQLKDMQAAEFEKWYNKQKWEIFNFHYENNNFYRNFVGPSKPDSWEEIPVINKSDFQLYNIGNKRYGFYKANTSGSSGHPFSFLKSRYAHARTWAFIINQYEKLGVMDGSMEARFYGIPLSGRSKYLELLKDFFLQRKRFPVFNMSDEVLMKYVNMISSSNFTYIYGYTSSISLFADFLLTNGINLKERAKSLKVIIVTSEVCDKTTRHKIERAFSLPVYCEYGASEFGNIGVDIGEDTWRVVNENLYLDINPIEGLNDIGEVLITDLFNTAFPFIKYNIGDLANLKLDNLSGYQILYNLSGRTNDLIRLPSGRVSVGLTFYYVSRSILESKGLFREFIIRQTAVDKFIIEYVADRELNSNEKVLVDNEVKKYLEDGLKIEYLKVNVINRPKTGKIKHFYSELE